MRKYINVLFLSLFFLLPSCSRQKKPNTLRLNNHTDITSLNPHTGVDLGCRIFQNALFEGLTRIGPDNAPQPGMAIAVENTPTQYTFHLRDPIAEKFAQAWSLALAPKSPCLRPDILYPIKNAEALKRGELPIEQLGVSAPDPYTLVVELEHPIPYFLKLVANPIFFPILPEEEPTTFNGPFRLVEWKRGDRIVMEKNPDYWEEIHIDRIECSFISDPTTALMVYEKGKLDWVGPPFMMLPDEAFETLSSYESCPTKGTFWLCMNTNHPVLANLNIRRALSLAVDRQAIATQVLFDEIPFKGSHEKTALECFHLGLQELGLTLEQFPTLTYSLSDFAGQKKIAQAILEMWRTTLGIKAVIQAQEWALFFDNLGTRNFDIGGCIWFPAFSDPISHLEFFKEKKHRYNASDWEDPRFVSLLRSADFEIDVDKRFELLAQAEKLLWEQMPIIPVYHCRFKYLKNEKLQGAFVSDLGLIELKWAHL